MQSRREAGLVGLMNAPLPPPIQRPFLLGVLAAVCAAATIAACLSLVNLANSRPDVAGVASAEAAGVQDFR